LVVKKNQSEYGYEYAYQLAREQLSNIDNIEQQCHKSGAQYKLTGPKRTITIEYLNKSYEISLPDIEISLTESEEAIPLRDKILILHYISQARGNPLTNKVISYKELPEGTNYFPTFHKRAIKPILNHFGKEPGILVDVAEKLGGYKADYGDIAVTINAFPRVPITFVLWKGDHDLPPEGNILFDSTISDYLPIEDINVLCEVIAWRLVKSYQ
jgi:hypothetical protein